MLRTQKKPNKWKCKEILKVAKSTNSCEDATLYLTLSPCKECAKLIHQSGIKRLVYLKNYKDTTGLQFLENAGVKIDHINISWNWKIVLNSCY